MHVITRKPLREFAHRHPDAQASLDDWYAAVKRARWQSIRDVRLLYPHADAVEVASGNRVTIFNIRGNKYRLITALHYNRQKAFILKVLTHKEYSLRHWKENL